MILEISVTSSGPFTGIDSDSYFDQLIRRTEIDSKAAIRTMTQQGPFFYRMDCFIGKIMLNDF